MALVVYDQGVRIQTPVSSLLPARNVEALTQPSRSRELPSSEDDRSQETHVMPRAAQQQRYSNKANQAYQATQQLNRREEDHRQRPTLVSQIMTSPVFSIPVGTRIKEAMKQFRQHHVHHLAVVDEDGRCHGVVSEHELLKRSSPLTQHGPTRDDLTIEGTYSTQLLAATPDTSIHQVAISFLKHHLTCLPIVSEQGRLLGIVTNTDLVHMVANEAARERWI